jgi:RHS repeat-associated protein
VKKDVAGQTTYYLYADEGLTGEYSANGTLQKEYGWQPDGIWGTNPVFMQVGGSYYFYHNDHLGTPQRLTDNNGATVWQAMYSAFGQATVDVNSIITNNLRFPGQYWDEETGLHWNWNRYYDPGTGRYVTKDPIGLRGGINLFSYVENSPQVYFDPKGLARQRFDFIWYGNYGGPGWTGGKWRTWEEILSTDTIPIPIDSQDWAYFRHDQCYGKARTLCKKQEQWKAFNDCDNKLHYELSLLSRNSLEWEYSSQNQDYAYKKKLLAEFAFVLQQLGRAVINVPSEIYTGIRK